MSKNKKVSSKIKFWDKRLHKNKIIATILILLGGATIFVEYDITFFIFSLMIGIPIFSARENCILIESRKEREKHR